MQSIYHLPSVSLRHIRQHSSMCEFMENGTHPCVPSRKAGLICVWDYRRKDPSRCEITESQIRLCVSFLKVGPISVQDHRRHDPSMCEITEAMTHPCVRSQKARPIHVWDHRRRGPSMCEITEGTTHPCVKSWKVRPIHAQDYWWGKPVQIILSVSSYEIIHMFISILGLTLGQMSFISDDDWCISISSNLISMPAPVTFSSKKVYHISLSPSWLWV